MPCETMSPKVSSISVGSGRVMLMIGPTKTVQGTPSAARFARVVIRIVSDSTQ